MSKYFALVLLFSISGVVASHDPSWVHHKTQADLEKFKQQGNPHYELKFNGTKNGFAVPSNQVRTVSKKRIIENKDKPAESMFEFKLCCFDETCITSYPDLGYLMVEKADGSTQTICAHEKKFPVLLGVINYKDKRSRPLIRQYSNNLAFDIKPIDFVKFDEIGK